MNPNIGKEGKKFSSEYQPENRGRKKGSRNRKSLLESLIGHTISIDNLALKQLKEEFPSYFQHTKEITMEELMLLRLAREAIMNKKPLHYIREILDRLDGKSTIMVKKEDEAPPINYEERNAILKEKITQAKIAKEKRDGNKNI